MTRRTVIRVAPGDSTLRGRWLGVRLRERREESGLSGTEVGARLDRSYSTVSRWETGEVLPRRPELLFLLDLYEVKGKAREGLLALYEAAREQPDNSEIVATAIADYEWLQRRAWKLETYMDTGVPGLLQTPDYAREVIAAWDPSASVERIERALTTRLARQLRLTAKKKPLQLSAVVAESVLHHLVGGTEVMRAQLKHLVDQSSLPNVDIRVVPFSAGAHAGFPGPFEILRFADERDLVYLETRGGDIYLEEPEPFEKAIRRLAKTSLSPRESAGKIATVRREMI